MNQRIWAALTLAAATSFCADIAGVEAQQVATVTVSVSDPSPGRSQTYSAFGASADNPPAPFSIPALPSSAPAAAAAAPSGPLVAYVKHTKAPLLIDQTVAAVLPGALFGPIAAVTVGAAMTISGGSDIVAQNGIEDPSGDMARDIAMAYAAAHGGRVADGSIADDHKSTRAKPSALAEQADGAQYVVDVDPPGMTLTYFPFDWEHRDLMFLSNARVIDASSDKIVAQAHCFIKTDDSYEMTHDELLADHAAELKQVIARKSRACVASIEDKLHLPSITTQESAAQTPGQSSFEAQATQTVYR